MNIDKDKFSPYQIKALKEWKELLESKTPLLIKHFKNIIEEYQFENIKDFTGKRKEIVTLEFSHNADDFDFTFCPQTINEDFESYDHGTEILKDIPCFGFNTTLNSRYPDDMDDWLEGHRDNLRAGESVSMMYEWFAENWIKCGGHKTGINSQTWQNSTTTTFNLSQINWEGVIDLPNPQVGQRVDYPLNRELTPFELRSRVRNVFSRGGSTNACRYFEKEDEFYELACYKNKIGIRQDKKSNFLKAAYEIETIPLSDWKRIYYLPKELAKKVDQLLNTGYYEIKRPECNIKLQSGLIELSFGIKEREDKESITVELHVLADQFNLSLPAALVWFISSTESIGKDIHFRKAFREWVNIEKFFTPSEIGIEYKRLQTNSSLSNCHLPFASVKDNGVLLSNTIQDEVLYMLASGDIVSLECTFEEFLGNCMSISKYFNPLSFHMDRGNAIMLKDYFDNGGTLSEIEPAGDRSILQDIGNIEVREVLLEHGADPNKLYVHGDRLSRKMLDLLLKYGLDIKAAAIRQSSLKTELSRREGFEDILSILE